MNNTSSSRPSFWRDADGLRLVRRGGRDWEAGTAETVEWIQRGFRRGLEITSSIPPVFDSYATVVDPWDHSDELLTRFDRATFAPLDTPDGAWLALEVESLRAASHGWQVQEKLVEVLVGYGSRSWWLGYLDTGADDPVFDHLPGVELYVGWPYKLVKAGPAQAVSWRVVLPDLMFPVDHSWCLSTGWDDSWTSLGGPALMIDRLCADPLVAARRVDVDEDSTPPGHIAI